MAKNEAQTPDIMERTRAAVCLINTGRISKRSEYFAFLTIFHPELSLERRLKMANEMAGDRP